MSRLIKFRGLMTDKQTWHCGDLVNNGTDAYGNYIEKGIADHGGCYPHPVLQDTIGQFTGLKDKNGVPIYEGDFLKRTKISFFTKTKPPVIDIGEVKWNEKKASFLFYKVFYSSLVADDIELEVIGNIHQHPNLLA